MVWPCRLFTSMGEYNGSCSRGNVQVETLWHRARKACCLQERGRAQGVGTLLLAYRTARRCWFGEMWCKLLLALVPLALKTCRG